MYSIKIVPTTGSHSLIIDLSNDVFFHIFYRQLTNILEIEKAVIRTKTLERGFHQKTDKNLLFFRKKIL